MESKRYLLSIIIPVYKVEKYLKNCINSVTSQNNGNIEIILVDDGSPDNCGKICDEYAFRYSYIQVVHQENKGLSIARNVGILKASGEYCLFLDSDDWMADDSVKILCSLLRKRVDVMVYRIKLYYEKEERIEECRYFFNPNSLSKRNVAKVYNKISEMKDFFGAAWMFIVRKAYIEDYSLYFTPQILHEDEDWVPRIFLNTKSIGYCNNSIYCVRMDRDDSITHTITSQHEFDKLRIISNLVKESKKDNYDFFAKKALFLRCMKLFVGICHNVSIYRDSNKEDYQKIIEGLEKSLFVCRLGGINKYFLFYLCCKVCGVQKVIEFKQFF